MKYLAPASKWSDSWNGVGMIDGFVVKLPEVYAESSCAVLSNNHNIEELRALAWSYSPSFKYFC